jgi:hypothetical protein
MKIIASLTTIPSRISFIFPTIQSILNQTIAVDSIEINVPYVFKRTGESYEIPDWLLQIQNDSKNSVCPVKVFRTDDLGAITKIAPALVRHKNSDDTYIWSVDDDFEYPQNMLAILYREHNPQRNYVLSHSGGTWIHNVRHPEYIRYKTSRNEGFMDFLEGFASVLYPTNIIEDDFESYINKTSETIDCRNSDDIIISNYLKLKGIKIYNCSYPNVKDRHILDEKITNYAKCDDALHKQGGGNTSRYMRVYNWLIENQLNGWVAWSSI